MNKIYRAILPHPAVGEFGPLRHVFMVLADKIRALVPEADISEMMSEVEALLDESIAAEGYVITEPDRIVDLSKIDFEALKKRFEQGRKRIEIEKLRGSVNQKLKRMVCLNRTRTNYLEKFEQMIAAYNAGSLNVDVLFDQLVDFIGELNEEDQRSIAEQLTEEELAVFDLLTRPTLILDDKERQQVKRVTREMLETLKTRKLALDWRKHQRSRAAVRLWVEEALDQLPEIYAADLYEQKCEQIYQHIYDSYFGPERSIYTPAAA
jgi:type I restriction enzyme R subunit